MVRIHAPGLPVHGWKDAAIGYWAQNNLEGTKAFIHLRAVGQAMELLCEVHRVVRR